MASFSDDNYDCSAYAACRPSPPKHLFDTVLAYHQAPRDLCIDLGCGNGAAARGLASHFGSIFGVDPSESMLKEARAQTKRRNVHYRQCWAESLPFVQTGTIDLVIACQAAHWFDPDLVWKEMTRIVRSGGTVAFWNWGNYVVVGHAHANRALRKFSSVDLASYWPQPGKAIWDDRMRPVECRDFSNWTDHTRLESDSSGAPHALRTVENIRMQISDTLGGLEALLRTWSSVHEWRRAHPHAASVREGGAGDIVDNLIQDMIEGEEDWRRITMSGGDWREIKLELETRSVLLMVRRA
ncbi:hypothetical protein ASPFODRAFT_53073 [Aspergillus luchuensis CBS 106.47]|uniref:Methyltransferase type 11 domain-containing protein n=1 Tax=Aspergillus luchuensis (strain CBS 106.47) TaxID=1137211 RepID=A0A1M3T196_ASPLC|nr:hypothetical protein ASPFODRAFT_53073 [Aspergillus luchuensis CBS 106.47]